MYTADTSPADKVILKRGMQPHADNYNCDDDDDDLFFAPMSATTIAKSFMRILALDDVFMPSN